MKNVKQLLAGKSSDVVTIHPEQSVLEAMQRMAERNIGALLVVDVAGKLTGIVSERDFVRKMFAMERLPRNVPVAEIMTRQVAYVRPEQTAQECMALITDKHVRHLPVLDGGRIIGLLSIGDLVRDTITEQQFIISQLENYIQS